MVNYAKQTGTYDLELEDMDLQAETVEKNVLIFGKGGRSDFGGDSFLEKVEANVLRKPMRKKEVEQSIKETLGGKTPEALQKELVENMLSFMAARRERETKEIEAYIRERIKNIHKEEKYGKVENKENYIRERKAELENSRTERIENMKKRIGNETAYIESFFTAVKTGASVYYKTATPDGTVDVPSVFLGFKINTKKTNPYAPSAIIARIATTDSNRYLELVLSGEQGEKLMAIFFASSRNSSGGDVLENWDTCTQNSNVNRRIRYIYTGNLLQAFDKAQSGKLISYTCKNGETKKGILMPEHWTPKEGGNNNRSVPLKFCRRAILGLSRGAVLNTDADISFMLQYDGNIRMATKSLSIEKFGWLVKNNEVIPLIRENCGFQKQGSSWVGSFIPSNIDRVIDIIDAKTNCNAMLSASQIELVQKDIVRTEVKHKERVQLPETNTVANDDKARRLRIAKARAQLELLNLLKI
jgi:hypothetical protein